MTRIDVLVYVHVCTFNQNKSLHLLIAGLYNKVPSKVNQLPVYVQCNKRTCLRLKIIFTLLRVSDEISYRQGS